MPKYQTLDHVVWYKNQPVPPYTEKDVPEEDVPTWEELVKQHFAIRVEEEKAEEPAPEEAKAEEEPASEEKPARSRRKRS